MKQTNLHPDRLQPENLQASFIAFLNAEIMRLRQAGRFGQAALVKNARNSITLFLRSQGQEDVSLHGLTTAVVCAYQQWLMAAGVKKNSSSCYMRTLQSAYNKATAGVEGLTDRPFARVYRGVARTKKRAAGISVIQRLWELDVQKGLTSMGRSPKRKTFNALLGRLELARDLFIFCYCARGMAFVDAAYLRKQDIRNGIIRYKRRKTGQTMEVAVEPMMKDIIDRHAGRAKGTPYVFPILPDADGESTYRAYRNALRTYNAHLKMLAQMTGADVCLSSHVARHSWASNMNEMDMPISVISQGLGHESERTTQIYIKSLENKIVHEANKAFINRVFSYPLLSQERDFFGCKVTQIFSDSIKKRKENAIFFCRVRASAMKEGLLDVIFAAMPSASWDRSG